MTAQQDLRRRDPIIASSRNFVFREVYEFVALVEHCAQFEDSFVELGLEDTPDLALRLQKPHKLSLLHEYIFAMIRTERSREYRKDSDLYGVGAAECLEDVFEEYEIPLVPITSIKPSKSEGHDPFYHWFLVNEAAFLDYWEKVTDEVFHIVFSNRRFLLQFGLSLSDHIKQIHHRLPPKTLSADGRIERFSRIPSWLKKAIFYRDHGRCVFCRADLSGLLATDRRLHFDHIVPLARWGTNDPSNFQVLCESCNLEKSDSPAKVGRFYVPWWDY
jgi:hypothetical protein